MKWGDLPAAAGFCRRGVTLEPDVEDGWWVLAGIGIAQRNVDAVLEALSGLEVHFDHRFDPIELVTVPEYAWLAGRPELAAWAKARNNRLPTPD